MYLIFLLLASLIIGTFGQNGNSTNSNSTTIEQQPASSQSMCGKQIDAWQNCQLKDIPRSAEGKLMKDKIDAIYEKCSTSMPKNCTSFWRAADVCFHQELDKIDTDPQINATKQQVLQTIDQCYQRTPNDPFADLFEELYPEMQLFDDGGLKAQQQIGFAGRKFVPPPQCAPTLENLQCVSKEMALLAQDVEAKKASNALRKQKRACDDKLTAECTPQSPPLWMCVDRAIKQFTRQTEEAMQKCMQLKSFSIMLRQTPPTAMGMGFPPPAPMAGQPMQVAPVGSAAMGLPLGTNPFVAPAPPVQQPQMMYDAPMPWYYQ